jgi:hypothetical protein
MQERLDKWRNKTLPVPSAEKFREKTPTRKNGKGDYGDANTLEEWDEECKRSQNRR